MAYYLVAFLKTSLKVFEYYKRVMYGGVFKNVTIDLKQQRYSNVFEHRKKIVVIDNFYLQQHFTNTG